jgi:hypothetical protein
VTVAFIGGSTLRLVLLLHTGGVQRLQRADLIVQASKDCVQKTIKRLEEKITGAAHPQQVSGQCCCCCNSHLRQSCPSAKSAAVLPAGKVLHQILYAMYSSDRAVQQRVATALARLAATADLKTVRAVRVCCCWDTSLHAAAPANCTACLFAALTKLHLWPAGVCGPAGAAGPGGHADGRQV